MRKNADYQKLIIVARRQKLKIQAIEYKGGACKYCNYSKSSIALCFHHIDPSTKSFSVSNGGLEKTWEVLKKELDKCELLCANCHAEEHEKLLKLDSEKESKYALQRRRLKEKYLDYKGKSCSHCGYNKSIKALAFHHLRDKSFEISSSSKSFDKIKAEIDKCIVLCHNCHLEHHGEDFNFKKIKASKKIDEFNHQSKLKKENIKQKINCSVCGKEKIILKSRLKKNNFCSRKCLELSAYKGYKNKPTKEELSDMLWKIPTTKIAANYSVSDKAVERWVKKFGLTKPPRGYWTKKLINK